MVTCALVSSTPAAAAADRARAKPHYAKVKELVVGRDAQRPELVRLNAMLTTNKRR